jgi:beta-phosphoglucomutase-like phosphatase (HAD superfamily)
MPGVEKLLTLLEKASFPRCVVTNSPNDHVTLLKKQSPLLQTIPLWIGRNEYTHPKPHPEPYLTATYHFPHIPKNRIVAFEDSLKGAASALAAGIALILISIEENPHLKLPQMADIPHLTSLDLLF